MGHWNILAAGAFAAALSFATPSAAEARSAWTCGFGDVSEIVKVEAQREATLSQRVFITDEGKVEVVRIIIDKPSRPRDLLAADLKQRLGIGASSWTGSVLGQGDETATLATELADWSLSPLRNARWDMRLSC